MPTYDYKCEYCGHEFEELQKITADPLLECPQCNHNALYRKPTSGLGISPSSNASSPKPGGCCPCGKNKNSCSS